MPDHWALLQQRITMPNPTVRSHGFLRLAHQFLQLARNACTELVARENSICVVVDGTQPIDFQSSDEALRWSDFRIGVPVLFNLFHGIELTMKAFLIHAGTSVPPHHRLGDLLTAFEALHGDSDLAHVLNACIRDIDQDVPLGRFLATNATSIDAWYQTLKYPETRGGDSVNHCDLQFGADATLAFWQSMGDTAGNVWRAAVVLGRSTGVAG